MTIQDDILGRNAIYTSSRLSHESKDNIVQVYSDSISNIYETKIVLIEDEIKAYKIKIDEKDVEQALINKDLQDRGYLYGSQKSRNKQLTEEKKYLDEKVDESEIKINGLKEERDVDSIIKASILFLM